MNNKSKFYLLPPENTLETNYHSIYLEKNLNVSEFPENYSLLRKQVSTTTVECENIQPCSIRETLGT